MMRYTESAEQSAELLRQALPYMARHGGTYHPTHYALWYEYLAESFPQLKSVLDARLTSSEPLDADEAAQLYLRHTGARETERTGKLQEGLLELMQQLGGVASTAGDGAARFVAQLEQAQRALASGQDAATLAGVLEQLSQHTTAMQRSAGALQAKVQSSQTEIAALRSELQELRSASLTDPLTHLNNRRGFHNAVQRLARENSEALRTATLLMADIDHFKHVNDTYGHLLGDQVIKAVAQTLLRLTKGGDIPVRFGGEEFAVLLPATSVDDAATLAEQTRAAFARVRLVRTGSGEAVTGITISLGVAGARSDETLEAWTERADRALYQAKQAGRNRVVCWQADS